MTDTAPTNFIRQIVEDDLASGKHDAVVTRFPPHPNGYLHIGHAKSICLNFGIAREHHGRCNLRFDDTNPVKEDEAFTDSIQEDLRWLGFQWDKLCYASDYYPQLYAWAVDLIRAGHAYVDSQSAEEIHAQRGTLTEPGVNSPDRDRSVEENLDWFARMKAGEFPDGGPVLRAKIDMASPNINLRDPVIYRVRHATHQRTGDDWCIYPMYDFAHGQSDAIEGITHSLCTLEFEAHRPLYDWFVEHLDVPSRPRQIEFARLNLEYTIMSKRKLGQLVETGVVDGWDDPRMPTIAGLRRRGYTAAAIRDFIERVGVARADSTVSMSQLEFSVREDLNQNAPRTMAVLHPLKLVIENYPEDGQETLELPCHPQRPEMGTRAVPFCRELYIERDDFMEDPPKKYFRLKPGGAVRLRGGYIVDFTSLVRDADGEVVEVRCRYDADTRSGSGGSGRKVKGTIHWVSARHSIPAEVRLYDRLFTQATPGAGGAEFLDAVNPDSCRVVSGARMEAQVAGAEPESHFQFERVGYFVADRRHHHAGHPVFNRTVALRDTWAKLERQAR